MFDPNKLRRLTSEDIRKLIFTAPAKAWTVPDTSNEGVMFELHSRFELKKLYRSFPDQFRDVRDAVPEHLERRVRIYSAKGFTRTEERPGDIALKNPAFALENTALGAVYVDVADQSYIHFSSKQIPKASLPTSLKQIASIWKVTEEENTLTLSSRGLVSIDVDIEYAPAPGCLQRGTPSSFPRLCRGWRSWTSWGCLSKRSRRPKHRNEYRPGLLMIGAGELQLWRDTGS